MDGKQSAGLTNVEAVHVNTPTADTRMEGVSKIEGVTSFASRKDSMFRYVITIADGKLNVWLEDRKTKLRWYVVRGDRQHAVVVVVTDVCGIAVLCVMLK